MEVRFLVDDLKLTPKDVEPAKTADLGQAGAGPASPPPNKAAATPEKKPGPTGGVGVTVDSIARPGTVVSGSVTFTDGNIAEWYLDQTGRLGLMPKT